MPSLQRGGKCAQLPESDRLAAFGYALLVHLLRNPRLPAGVVHVIQSTFLLNKSFSGFDHITHLFLASRLYGLRNYRKA